ncbi:MAG: DUF2339 domain-containing protein [Opitutaceae bacterium]|nr:DUF2339 domain-containing protein [Opitutaceae bacterium]
MPTPTPFQLAARSMIAGSSQSAEEESTAARLAHLEERLARIEAHIGLLETEKATQARRPLARIVEPPAPTRREDELEFEVGQNWFARVGILALAAGGAFMLTLPYPNLPSALPTIVGVVVAALAFGLTRVLAHSFEVVSCCLRVAGMALLYFAVLRLFYFGAHQALGTDSYVGRGLLVLAVGINLAIALSRQSPWLTGLALTMGYMTAIAIGSGWFVLGLLLVLSIAVVVVSWKQNWPGLMPAGIVLTFATYLTWAIVHGGTTAPRLAAEPALAPVFALACMMILGAAPLFRRTSPDETLLENGSALLNCALGYGAFLLHTLAAFDLVFAPAHAAASLLFLGFAVLFWTKQHCYGSTFFYAMTGYVALSVAILKVSSTPDVFVWLSLQSMLVVATAIWFRSRFIVVANFAIYVAVVLAYVLVNHRETGISIGFGIVALISARLLNWQKHRLELKTELMRNAYLLSAFVVLPYALYHLLAGHYVALAWVGLALFYYILNLIVRNQKHRWMGHATLLLTALYLMIIGSRQFDPVYRVISFLVLGTVLLIVSFSFTRLRLRQRGRVSSEEAN